MTFIRNTHVFTFLQGCYEHLDGCGGRTHETDQDWNEAYDRGMNLADRLRNLVDWKKIRTFLHSAH